MLYLSGLYPLDEDDVNEIEKIFKAQGFNAATAEIIKRLEIKSKDEYIPYSAIAWRYYLINQDNEALECLEKAFEAHENLVYISAGLPYYSRLYENPRFISIVEKMNLPLPKK